MRLLAFILLLSHVNFSMFIAQLDEKDVYDKNGQQVEDVNSLAQYVADVFHCNHKPLKDSDDDNARYFHIAKDNNYSFTEPFVVLKNPYSDLSIEYPAYLQQKINPVFAEIISPPPKA